MRQRELAQLQSLRVVRARREPCWNSLEDHRWLLMFLAASELSAGMLELLRRYSTAVTRSPQEIHWESVAMGVLSVQNVSAAVSPKLRLTPPERWFASWALERQGTLRTPTVLRLEKNYGPQGIALMAAGFVWFFTGWIVGVIGIVLLVISNTRDPVSCYLIYVAIIFEILVFIRCAQGVRVGRWHRANRPLSS
ncbi:MAG: hypothetical protein JWM55_722 [Acidimicrobiaceae bacterium]|nr:hypothetical protein [Acidimicrobiaceae bacterium]